MSTLTATDRAMIEAGAIAALFLEATPADLMVVERTVNTGALALAILFCEVDAEFHPRWVAAGADWVKQAEVLRDALLYVLTPEAPPAAIPARLDA